MKIYQRMLYIGLGGTGLKIGAQLEQRLRTELCGADGRRLLSEPAFQQLHPFELPPFVQFVYADYDDSARQAVEQASERMTGSASAARNTAIYISNLTPPANSYARVAEALRTGAPASVRGWLPRPENEPQVAPLSNGAGQFPTVGRAAMFETFRAAGALGPIETPLREAVRRLAIAGGALDAHLGHSPRMGCDIFLGFSVAGGTGAGIFYDFMRVAAAIVQAGLGGETEAATQIYPLILLPSSFEIGRGGGRAAQLNGGPALRELFQMINNSNEGRANDPVLYPGDKKVDIGDHVPVKTAFLFKRPDALTLDDLHRSIVAFMISMIGTEVKKDHATLSGSFASEFVNEAGERRQAAPDGMGLRPASTALTGQLTVPLAEISEILASRLVAKATRELDAPHAENNRDLIRAFITASGLGPLYERNFDDPLPSFAPDTKGAKEIFAALTQLRQNASQQRRGLRQSLQTRVAALAQEFNWGAGVRAIAAQNDLFRVSRVALGDPRLSENRIDEEGVMGFVQRRGERFDAPVEHKDFTNEAPTPPKLGNKVLGTVKAKMSDGETRNYIQCLNDWYVWRTRADWNEFWGANRDIWNPNIGRLRTKLREIIDSFKEHAQNEPTEFQSACQTLYQPRTGVVYFLPDGGAGNDLDAFYRSAVIPKLRERLGLGEGADEGQILNRIVGQRWLDAYEATAQAPNSESLQYIQDLVEKQVYEILAQAPDDENPILPRLKALLTAIASEQTAGFPSGLMERFRSSLTALLPAGFAPPGDTELKIQVFYPDDAPNPQTEDFLRRHVLGGRDATFNPVADANFLGITLTRTELSATGVDEFRELMRMWGDALDEPRPGDMLPWRQRLGYDSRWILLSQRDRERIMLSFLNALWDGSVEVLDGVPESPERIRIHQKDSPDAPPIELELKAYGRLSRWTTLLRAYERYALSDDPHVSERCFALTRRLTPTGAADDPGKPSALYETFVNLIPVQEKLAIETYESVAEAARGRAQQAVEFWTETVRDARKRSFEGEGGPMGRNHEELYDNYLGLQATETVA